MPLPASRGATSPSLRSPVPNARAAARGRSASATRRPATRDPAPPLRPASPAREAAVAAATASSPATLTRSAARAVVKTVRNAIYPPKENPFVEDAGRGREGNSGQRRTSEEPAGQQFLRAARAEASRLSALVEEIEAELAEEQERMPDEVQEKLRAAAGQARLLIKKKMQQFEGLCHKNIAHKPGEGFPTTAQDLAGFWDMVLLQVDQVDRQFAEIDDLRRAGWSVSLRATAGGGAMEAEAGGWAGAARAHKQPSAGGRRNSAISPDSFYPSLPKPAQSADPGYRAERFQPSGKGVVRTTTPVAEVQRNSSDTKKKIRDKTPEVEARWTLGSCSDRQG